MGVAEAEAKQHPLRRVVLGVMSGDESRQASRASPGDHRRRGFRRIASTPCVATELEAELRRSRVGAVRPQPAASGQTTAIREEHGPVLQALQTPVADFPGETFGDLLRGERAAREPRDFRIAPDAMGPLAVVVMPEAEAQALRAHRPIAVVHVLGVLVTMIHLKKYRRIAGMGATLDVPDLQ